MVTRRLVAALLAMLVLAFVAVASVVLGATIPAAAETPGDGAFTYDAAPGLELTQTRAQSAGDLPEPRHAEPTAEAGVATARGIGSVVKTLHPAGDLYDSLPFFVAPNGLVNETAGGFTNLGRGSARGPAFFDDFSPGQGFSGVYDEATGSILAFPSGPGGVVAQYGGHGVVNQRLTQAIGAPGGQRAGFTAILQTDGSLAVRWSSRSVNGPGAARFVPESLRPAIMDALAATSGRTVVG